MSPFSKDYVSQLAPLPTQGRRQSRPVIVPLPKNPAARIAEKQPSREDAIRRGNSFCNGVKA